MKERSYIQGVTFCVTPEMYAALRTISDEQKESVSETIRGMIEECLKTHNRIPRRAENKHG